MMMKSTRLNDIMLYYLHLYCTTVFTLTERLIICDLRFLICDCYFTFYNFLFCLHFHKNDKSKNDTFDSQVTNQKYYANKLYTYKVSSAVLSQLKSLALSFPFCANSFCRDQSFISICIPLPIEFSSK